jgi:hypothetical protein
MLLDRTWAIGGLCGVLLASQACARSSPPPAPPPPPPGAWAHPGVAPAAAPAPAPPAPGMLGPGTVGDEELVHVSGALVRRAPLTPEAYRARVEQKLGTSNARIEFKLNTQAVAPAVRDAVRKNVRWGQEIIRNRVGQLTADGSMSAADQQHLDVLEQAVARDLGKLHGPLDTWLLLH